MQKIGEKLKKNAKTILNTLTKNTLLSHQHKQNLIQIS